MYTYVLQYTNTVQYSTIRRTYKHPAVTTATTTSSTITITTTTANTTANTTTTTTTTTVTATTDAALSWEISRLLLYLYAAIGIRGKDTAREVLVRHCTELLRHPSLHGVKTLFGVHHYLHQVGRVVLEVEANHHVTGVQTLALGHSLEGLQVAGREGIQGMIQRLEQLEVPPGIILL